MIRGREVTGDKFAAIESASRFYRRLCRPPTIKEAPQWRHHHLGWFGVFASLPRAAIDHIDLPLTDLDKVPVRVADIGADFIAAVDGISHELGAARTPLAVHMVNVGNTDVYKRANGALRF